MTNNLSILAPNPGSPQNPGVGNGTRMQVLSGLKAGDKVVLPG